MVSNAAIADATPVIPAELSIRPDLIRQLVPPHCEPELVSRSIDLDNFVPIPLEQLKISLD
jgi:glycogen synthase kinase 3 beta